MTVKKVTAALAILFSRYHEEEKNTNVIDLTLCSSIALQVACCSQESYCFVHTQTSCVLTRTADDDRRSSALDATAFDEFY